MGSRLVANNVTSCNGLSFVTEGELTKGWQNRVFLNTDRLFELNANARLGKGADEFRLFFLYYLILRVLLFCGHNVLNSDVLGKSVHVEDARIGTGHDGFVGEELKEFDVSFDDLGGWNDGVLVTKNVSLVDTTFGLNVK